MEAEFEKSKNPEEDERPIEVARRAPEVSEDVNSGAADSFSHPPRDVIIYSAQSPIRNPVQLIRDIFTDFWLGRGLAWRLFLRNIRGLYRQTLLGLFWAFLPPIANTAIWIFLRQANVFSMGDTQVDGTVYILTGMILWQAFIDAFQMPLAMLNKNRNMISKLNFPREALLLVGIGEVVFDLLIRLLLLIPAFLIFQVPVHTSILFAPIAILGLVLLGAALGLLLMPIGSLYQDVGRFISMVLPFWMIITPIIYVPLTSFPGSLLNWVNPASPLLLLARDWLLLGTTSHFTTGLIFGAAAIPMLLIALVVYRISIPVLIERMTA
jgi:lipopolysaccharide transport system permease protein